MCNVGLTNIPASTSALLTPDQMPQIIDIGEQEFVACVIESLLSELSFCLTQQLLQFPPTIEKALSESIGACLFGKVEPVSRSLAEVLDSLAEAHRNIAAFIRRKFIYKEAPPVPIATFDLALLKRIIHIVKTNVAQLTDALFVLLLDEYENLFPYQQQIVNGFVKFGPPHFTVKIAKKLGSNDTSATTTGQDLQEIHDYTRVPLVYDVEDPSSRKVYEQFLTHIVINILNTEGITITDLTDLLPQERTPEVDPNLQKQELLKLCKVSADEFDSWPDIKRREKATYYGEAATYRVLYGSKGRQKGKRFSGFKELAFLSSGVIRYFQEILGVAYHLTYAAPPLVSSPISLPPDTQSRAVHFVSQHNITTLSRNVESDGEALKYFLLDLGDCLRQKLLKHSSEPEAARLTITDPERLDQCQMTSLKRLLTLGIREGVFQTKEGLPAFKPKHSSDPQPAEFNVSRIFAPVLQISPRLRWRTEVSCAELLGLALWEQRANAMQQLKTSLVRGQKNKSSEQRTLL